MDLSVGFEGQPPLRTEVDDFKLIAIPGAWLAFWMVMFLALLLVLVWYGRRTNLLRDFGPDPGGGALKRYSLARTQMAAWFFVVLGSPNDFFAQAVVVTKGLEERERVKAKLQAALATEFPNIVGRVYPLELGPPVGWPLQYRVSGPEPGQVRAIAFNVAQVLAPIPLSRMSTTTGWSRRGRSGSGSTRTRLA